MKQLTCEMCGSTDLMKDGGVFVCQSCGCKYSVEEARKMMVEGTVDVQGTVKIDATGSIDNYLDLAHSAIEAGNGESAIEYANKALEIAPKDSRAWLIKMDAIKLIATFGDLKLKDMLESGKNAIAFAESEERKTEIEEEVYGYYLLRALELLKLATEKFSDTADIENTFKQFVRISFLTAGQHTLEVDTNLVNLYEGLNTESHALTSYVPDEALINYDGFARLLNECAKQYRFATEALEKRYAIYGATLLETAKKVREEKAKEMEDRANKAMEERKAAFFRNNPEAQAQLDDYNSRIQALKDDVDSKKTQIADLESQVKSLGFFKNKEKGELRERISVIQKEIKELESKAKELEEEKNHLGE